MAITVLSAPGGFGFPVTFYSMHAPLLHTVSSTNIAQPDFRFLFDVEVYISGSPVGTARLKVSPDPVTGYGVVDVSRIVRSFLTSYFAPTNTTAFSPFTMDTNEITIVYNVYYGEEYGGVFYTGLSSDSYYAYNNYTGDTPDPATLAQPLAPYQHSWATNRDINNIYIPRDGNAFISYINDPEENLRIRVIEVDEDGAAIGTLYTSDLIMSLDKLLVLNLNLDWINAAPFTATPAPIDPSAAGYALTILRADGVTETAPIVVRWLCEAKTEATAVHFLNMHGGFDTYHFEGPTRKSVDVERKTFERLQRQGLAYENVVQYNTRQKWSRRLSSAYLSDVTNEWLWQLVVSPQVFLADGAYPWNYYPVTIKTSNWQEKKTRFDKLYTLEIEINMSRNVTSQNR